MPKKLQDSLSQFLNKLKEENLSSLFDLLALAERAKDETAIRRYRRLIDAYYPHDQSVMACHSTWKRVT